MAVVDWCVGYVNRYTHTPAGLWAKLEEQGFITPDGGRKT
jgi:hypothetical protein